MKRPVLMKADHHQEVACMLAGAGDIFITMPPGQWDMILEGAYEAGCTLLELEHNEQCVAADLLVDESELDGGKK